MYNKIDLREVPAERLKEISLDLVNIDAQAPEFEPNRQFYFMAKARDYVKRKSAELGRPMTFFTQTFGWGIAAWPVDTFVEANDFTGKTVIPFATSASSGLGESGQLLAELAGTGDWQEGMRFRSSVSEGDMQEWLDSLSLS